MKVSKEELMHIANLADLEISENETDKYLKNLEDILNYTNILDKIDTSKLDETIGANDNYNVFRKDEIKQESNKEELLANAPSQDEGMFRIPKVIN